MCGPTTAARSSSIHSVSSAFTRGITGTPLAASFGRCSATVARAFAFSAAGTESSMSGTYASGVTRALSRACSACCRARTAGYGGSSSPFCSATRSTSLPKWLPGFHCAVRVRRLLERIHGIESAARSRRSRTAATRRGERMDDRGLLLGGPRPQHRAQDALPLREQPADVELAFAPAHDADHGEPAAESRALSDSARGMRRRCDRGSRPRRAGR